VGLGYGIIFHRFPSGTEPTKFLLTATVSLAPVASAANRGNGDESPPVGLPLRAGFRMNISTSRARPRPRGKRPWGWAVALRT
jgi:hypothetical protein